MSTPLQHNSKLDHLRLLASLLVFLFHFYYVFYDVPTIGGEDNQIGIIVKGYIGVSLFFVLSGFLFMSIGLHKKTINYWPFIYNRFLRIFPLYFVVFSLSIATKENNINPVDLMYVFFTTLKSAPLNNSMITAPAWSISVEFLFYFSFPFLLKFSLDKGIRYLLSIVVLLIFIKLIMFSSATNPAEIIFTTALGRLDQFVWGAFFAWIYFYYKEESRLLSYLILGLSLYGMNVYISDYAVYFSDYDAGPKEEVFHFMWSGVESFLWGAVILGYLSLSINVPKLIDSCLIYLSRLSYSIYLWHSAVLFLGSKYFDLWVVSDVFIINFTVNLFIYAFVLIVLSHFSYITIEKPFLEMRKKY